MTADNNPIIEKLDTFDRKLRELAIRESEAAFAMYRGLEHEDLDTIEAETTALWREAGTVEVAKADPPGPEFERPFFLIRQGVLRDKVEGIEEIYKAKNECNQMLVKFKIELEGAEISRSDLGELIRWDPDPAKRRRAAASFVPLEKDMHKLVLSLIHKRNKAAKELGFESYPHLVFELNELDLDEVRFWLEALVEEGAEAFKGILEDYQDRPEMTPGGLVSSDLAFMHENYLPNLPRDKFPSGKLIDVLKAEYLSVGIDIEKLPIKTVIQDIPAGGFCFTFDPGKDTRILANPRDGQMWYQVLFHEYGHAVQGSTTRGDGRYFVALGDPGYFWEGIAVLFEKLALRKSFLKKYVGSDREVADFMDGVKKRSAYRMRRLAVDSLFEYWLYLDPMPYEELQKRRADMNRKLFFVEPAVEPVPFTTDIFHITHPCYLQNYVLAEMFAEQVLEASGSTTGDPWDGGFANRVVDEMLVPGGMKSWKDKVRGFTGKALSSDALIKTLYNR